MPLQLFGAFNSVAVRAFCDYPPVVLVGAVAFRDNRPMDPSPGPWTFRTHVYRLSNVLLDRDGRVISCHLKGLESSAERFNCAEAKRDTFSIWGLQRRESL